MSEETVTIYFSSQEKRYSIEFTDLFPELLERAGKITSETPEELLLLMFRTFSEHLLSLLEGKTAPAVIAGQIYDILKELENATPRCIFCEDCSKHGHTLHPAVEGEILLCGDCISKRRKGKSNEAFQKEMRDEYEKRTGNTLDLKDLNQFFRRTG